MTKINVPVREEVAANNQQIFDTLKGAVGFVPNLYAVMAHTENGLGNYLQLQNGKSLFSKKEKEVINLVVSQVNGCRYCQSAHTVIGKMNGFNDTQVLELRAGTASFDKKLDALAKLAKEITETKGYITEATLNSFFAAGYSKGHVIDLVIAIADKIVMNYLHNLTQVPIDFPVAPELTNAKAA